jgi:hypothetical protein
MSEITLANSLREKMLRDEVAYTLSVKLVRTVELPMMAKTSGFDGILIDMEHSSFDLDTTSKYIYLPACLELADESIQVNYVLQHFTQALRQSFAYPPKIRGLSQEYSMVVRSA